MALGDASYQPMGRDGVSELAFLVPARVESGARARHRPRGAREALIELYGEHYAPLVRLAHLVAHDPSIAEDLVHEAFIKLYGSWHRVRDQDRAPAYLRTTLVNLARGRADATTSRCVDARLRRPTPRPPRKGRSVSRTAVKSSNACATSRAVSVNASCCATTPT